MDQDHQEKARGVADHVLEMAEELEASGDATLEGSALETARAVLHGWIDEMTAVVVLPALGRVTLIHPGGVQSSISSPDLPFTMSVPLRD